MNCIRACKCGHDVNVHIDKFNDLGEKISQRCMAQQGYHIGVPPVKRVEDSICECTSFDWDKGFVWVPPEKLQH